jgi:hypothetical protein
MLYTRRSFVKELEFLAFAPPTNTVLIVLSSSCEMESNGVLFEQLSPVQSTMTERKIFYFTVVPDGHESSVSVVPKRLHC